jgi:AraC-like DNA-binding protein
LNGAFGKSNEDFGMKPTESPIKASRRLPRNRVSSPLGGVTVAGTIRAGRGVEEKFRVFGKYAAVYLAHGSGLYREPGKPDRPLRAGDLITVFPEIPHWYGPLAGGRWDEIFIVFEGPVFDLWRESGLLDPAQPIRHLEPISYWHQRFAALTGSREAGTPAQALQETVGLQSLLAEAHGSAAPGVAEPWLLGAKAALERQPDDRSAARSLGVSYETFRKRFTAQAGMSPGRYRAARRMDAACVLLADRALRLRDIADRLGFSDEFHFSRRFKQLAGMSPSQFRG